MSKVNSSFLKSLNQKASVLIILISLIVIQPVHTEISYPTASFNNTPADSTIFTVSIGDTILFGSNEDSIWNDVCMWSMPSQTVEHAHGNRKSIYGTILLGVDYYNWDRVGMNEHGLICASSELPTSNVDFNYYSTLPWTLSHLVAHTLWDCKDVDEVIAFFSELKLDAIDKQFHYADKNGNAVVVSVNATGRWTFTNMTTNYLVSTNYNLANYENGEYPCSRYTSVTQMLNEITIEEDLTISACSDILYAVHQEGELGTKYSNIFDPVNMDLYLNQGWKFWRNKKISVMDKIDENNSFEEVEAEMFGVFGLDGKFLINKEKIQTQFRTGGVRPIIYVIIGVGSAVFIGGLVGAVLIITKKRRKIK